MASVARVTEISTRSDQSFEDAMRTGIERANKTLRNVRGAWVKEQGVDIEDGLVDEVEAAQVVEPRDVVSVRVRVEHSVDAADAIRDRLEPKFWRGVDEQPLAARLDQRRCPAALVAWVW